MLASKHFLLFVRYATLLLLIIAFRNSEIVASENQAAKPNVILFLVDDMGWMDCGAYGSKYYETPNIDRFASRAMRFTNAYSQPLCSPTRASLLTGKYSSRHGITSATGHQPPQAAGTKLFPESASPSVAMFLPESKNYLEPSEYTLGEAFRDAGYRTAHIGKWHLGLTRPYWPEQQGFDFGFHCHPDPGPPGNYFSPYGVSLTGEPQGQSRVGTITDGPAGEYIMDRLADEAIKFISENKDRPFFLNLWNYGVHGPWGHKPEYTKAFVSKKDPTGRQGNPIMASMLKSVDECYGRILDSLEKQGLTKNTVVVFNSDNGGNTHSNVPATSKTEKAEKSKSEFLADWRKWAGDQPPTLNTPLRDGKGTLYEGGTRVPLMWSWPDHIQPGSTNDSVVGHIDVYPTLVELIGLQKPSQQKMDGVSYAKVLRSEGYLDRKAFFNYFPHGQSPGRAGGVWVRSGEWKLIRWFGVDQGDKLRHELYNLKDDLGESKNLAANEPARVKELDAMIDEFLIDTNATYPRPNPAYQPNLPKAITKKASDAADPLEGWKARQCEAIVKDGILTISSKGQSGAAFLGHGTGKTTGPVSLSVRLRSPTGGTGKIEWLGDVEAGAQPKSVSISVPAGDWSELKVMIPADGLLGTMRLYLPSNPSSVEVDWIELQSKEVGVKPQRWDFNTK